MTDFLKLIGMLVLVTIGTMLLIVGLILFIFTPLMILDCNQLGQNTHKETQFKFFGGGQNSCIVKIDGQWIPTNNWIYNNGK